MVPLSLLAAQKLQQRLTAGDALSQTVAAAAGAAGVTVPGMPSSQVLLSAATQALADESLQLVYPRVCIYSTGMQNAQAEKFRSFSGQVSLAMEVWTSADLVTQADAWIHYYVEGVGRILRNNIGDWGDGMFFGGGFDVQFVAPKAGGLGFVEAARITLALHASVN